MPQGALHDLLILDLSRVLAGPYCTMMLGDLGATVIKIEEPGVGDGTRQWGPPWAATESAYFLSINRNKKSMALNLRHEAGRQIVRRLAGRADVLLENFKLGAMQKWGLGYDRLKALNPRLIYCSITGYGQNGPYRHHPGYDFIIQAQGGIMSICGPVEGPPYKVGVAIVDITAGMYAGIAILAALHQRQRSGKGQYIDIALFDSQIAWLANVGSNYLISGEIPKRYGNAHPNIVPYETFEASDGWFAVGVGTDRQYRDLCRLMQRSDLAEDPRFASNALRVKNRHLLIPLLAQEFRTRTVADWVESLLKATIPCGPINTIDQVFADPQAQAREMVVEIPHPTAGSIKLAGSPLKLSGTPVQIKTPPPLLGQHTEQVLTDLLGYEKNEIENMRAEGIIG